MGRAGTTSSACIAVVGERPITIPSPFVPMTQHPVMPPAVFPVHINNCITVGGMHISGSLPLQASKQGHGKRGGDKKPRKSRTCRLCMSKLGAAGKAQALLCKGRCARGTCEYYSPELDQINTAPMENDSAASNDVKSCFGMNHHFIRCGHESPEFACSW